MLNRPTSFRKGASALTRVAAGAALLGIAATASFPAAAQQAAAPYSAEQCDQIRSNILGIFKRYDGKISGDLVADLQEFSKKNCDRTVRIRMIPGTRDNDAVGELKVLMASRSKVSSLENALPR